jgi:hypothetical protein
MRGGKREKKKGAEVMMKEGGQLSILGIKLPQM